MPLLEQELLTWIHPRVSNGVSFVMFVSLSFFLLEIVLSLLFLLMATDYPFGIFKLYLIKDYLMTPILSTHKIHSNDITERFMKALRSHSPI